MKHWKIYDWSRGKKEISEKSDDYWWVGPGGVERCDVEGPGRLVDYAVKEKKKCCKVGWLFYNGSAIQCMLRVTKQC